MADPITRVTLFMPGAPSSETAWSTALAPTGLRIEDGTLCGDELAEPDAPDIEWVPNDGEFGKAFSFGTVEADRVAEIDAAPGALILQWPIDLLGGRSTIVTTLSRLRAAGALAVRIEQSKLGWDIARWIELFSSDDPWSWHRGAVAFLRRNGVLQSRGMHAFSLPDVWIQTADDPQGSSSLASMLDVYQLAEDPVLRSGETFSPDQDTPRRVLERWPDTSYAPDHVCHNPYGVWRIGAPGGAARSLSKLTPVFMPTLSAILAALEDKLGKPLTQKEVEQVRDEGVCIAMETRDAQQLDRERGYADLDPELVWEQWQLVRTNLDN